MSYGLPIVATKVGGLFESLSKYEGTFFVDPCDVEGLAKAIVDVYHQKRKRYSPPEELKWENISKKWITLLEYLT